MNPSVSPSKSPSPASSSPSQPLAALIDHPADDTLVEAVNPFLLAASASPEVSESERREAISPRHVMRLVAPAYIQAYASTIAVLWIVHRMLGYAARVDPWMALPFLVVCEVLLATVIVLGGLLLGFVWFTSHARSRRMLRKSADVLTVMPAARVSGGRARMRGRVRLVKPADHVWGVAAFESRGGLGNGCPEAYSAASAGRGEVVSCCGEFVVDDGSGVVAKVPPSHVRVLEGHRETQSGNTIDLIRDGDFVELVGDASVRLEPSAQGFRGLSYALTFAGTKESPLLLSRVDAPTNTQVRVTT